MPFDQNHEAQTDQLINSIGLPELINLAHARARAREHAAHQALEPPVEVAITDADWQAIRLYAARPVTDLERTQGGLDYLCQTAAECLYRDDRAAALFALLRVLRKVWALQPHLGPSIGL